MTSAPPRNVGGARLLLAPCDHQGAGGRNEAPPAPVRCRWGLCSVILRGVEARRRQPKKWRRRNILSRGLSLPLPEASRLAACSPGARLPTTPTSTIPIIIVLNDAPEQPDETRDAVDHLCAAGGDSHYVPLAPAKIRDFPEDLLDHAVLS